MPHVLGIGAGGNQAYVNVGSGTPTYLGAGMSVTAQGAFQSVGVGNNNVVGNTRGTGALDLQTYRTAATQVASGIYSVVAGANSTSSANTSVAIGNGCSATANFAVSVGSSNTSSGVSAFTAGTSCTASGTRSAAIGSVCTASGDNGFACGNTASATATNSFACNVNCIASANASFAYGYQATARRAAESVHASGQISAQGDAQTCRYEVTGYTTNATPTEMLIPLGSARQTLQNDSTVLFHILLVARRGDVDNESAGYEFKGVIDRNGNAASTALVGAVTKTVIAEDTVAWDANVTADTTNGAISLTVTGEAAKTIRWVASVTLVEVIG